MSGAIQGRVGALDHLNYHQRDELLENKYVMSSQFKTGYSECILGLFDLNVWKALAIRCLSHSLVRVCVLEDL